MDLSKFSVRWIMLLLGFLMFQSCTSGESKDDRPNIILFLVDDMGWQDTSEPFWEEETPFNKIYKTPNMERLAREGVKFTQAYATPVCSPTRISLMTGMNAARHRVTNWTLQKGEMKRMELNHKILSFPFWQVNGLSAEAGDSLAVHADPLPKVLKESGYRTIHCGKAHLGAIGTPGADPLNLGFDVNIAGHAAGAPQSYLGTDAFGNNQKGKETWAVPGLEKYHGKDIFLTEALTIEALNHVDTSIDKGEPFFLYMSHYAVHSPLMADKRFVADYLEEGMDSTEAKYASLLEGMDKSLGDIMDFISEKGVEDNTIILFMSDNGGLSAVARGGQRHTHNLPLSSGKGSMHEGGIRVPMIVKWPGASTPNTTTDVPIIIEDYYPSILEMAGMEDYNVVQEIDGESFTSKIRNEFQASDERAFIWHYPNEWGPTGPGVGAASTIRLGDWKLVYYHVDQSLELFNIKEDIGETQNRLKTEMKRAEDLATRLTKELQNMNAQMPRLKESGLQIPYPIGSKYFL